jgi:hypothetical protein
VSTGAETGYVDINVGLQATSTAFDITTHPLTFVEPATVQTTYSVKGAREFDVGGGVRVTHHLAVGGSISKFEKGGNVTVDAQVPHPFFFDRARKVSGTADNLSRLETGFHGKVVFIAPVGAGWEVLLSAVRRSSRSNRTWSKTSRSRRPIRTTRPASTPRSRSGTPRPGWASTSAPT